MLGHSIAELDRPGESAASSLRAQGRTAPQHMQLFVAAVTLGLFLLPIERIAGPFSLRPVDGINFVVILLGLASSWSPRRRLAIPLAVPMWLIFVGSLISMLPSVYLQDNVVALLQEVYLFLWFVVLANRLGDLPLRTRRRLMAVWAAVAAVESVLALLGMFRLGPAFLYTAPERRAYDIGGISRAVGTFANSNAAGSYISTSFFVALGLPLPPGLRVGLCLLCLMGIYATGSMGAIVSTLLSLPLLVVGYSLMRDRRHLLFWSFAAALTAGVAVLLPMLGFSVEELVRPGAGGALFRTSLGRISYSVEGRLLILSGGWREFLRRPLGVGPNTFGAISASLHNDYAAFLFERGLLGFLGWLGLVGGTLVTTVRAARRISSDAARTWTLLALGAGFLSHALNAFAHEVSHFRYVWLLMAFLFAEVMAIDREGQ